MDDMQRGRAEALGVLFDRYYRLVFDVAKRVLRDRAEAEDLMQDVFIEVFKKANLYDSRKGSVKVWLLQYAYHRSFNRRKYLALRSFYDASPTSALAHLEMGGGHEGMRASDWKEILEPGMKELTEKERQIIELVTYEGLTVREASEHVQESYVNSRNHYYRGLKKLREFLSRLNSQSLQGVTDVRS